MIFRHIISNERLIIRCTGHKPICSVTETSSFIIAHSEVGSIDTSQECISRLVHISYQIILSSRSFSKGFICTNKLAGVIVVQLHRFARQKRNDLAQLRRHNLSDCFCYLTGKIYSIFIVPRRINESFFTRLQSKDSRQEWQRPFVIRILSIIVNTIQQRWEETTQCVIEPSHSLLGRSRNHCGKQCICYKLQRVLTANISNRLWIQNTGNHIKTCLLTDILQRMSYIVLDIQRSSGRIDGISIFSIGRRLLLRNLMISNLSQNRTNLRQFSHHIFMHFARHLGHGSQMIVHCFVRRGLHCRYIC